MSDYTKLIKALRCEDESCKDDCPYCKDGWCDPDGKMAIDAADAIEELQHRVIQLEAYMDAAEEEAETLYSEHEKLKQQLPKHGEWIPMTVSSGRDSWKCSVCGRRARGKLENLPYCHCGAKMGVQDAKEN